MKQIRKENVNHTKLYLTYGVGRTQIIIETEKEQIWLSTRELELIDARPEIKLPTPPLPTQDLLSEPVTNKKVIFDKWGDL